MEPSSTIGNLIRNVNEDAAQFAELNKYKTGPRVGLVIDEANQRIQIVTNRSLAPNELMPKSASTETVTRWAEAHVVRSREDVINLVVELENSTNPMELEEGLQAISRLEAEILKVQALLTRQNPKHDKDLLNRLETIFKSSIDQVELFAQAKTVLGYRIQHMTYPPSEEVVAKKVAKASPYLQTHKGIKESPPTENRYYYTYSQDGTLKTYEKIFPLFDKLNKEVSSKEPYNLHPIRDHELKIFNIFGTKIEGATAKEIAEQVHINVLTKVKNPEQAYYITSLLAEQAREDLELIAFAQVKDMGYEMKEGKSFIDVKIVEIELQPQDGESPEALQTRKKLYGTDYHVIITHKTVYTLGDPEEKDLNPGAIMVKKETTIPLSNLTRATFNPQVQAIESWSSILKTEPYALNQLAQF